MPRLPEEVYALGSLKVRGVPVPSVFYVCLILFWYFLLLEDLFFVWVFGVKLLVVFLVGDVPDVFFCFFFLLPFSHFLILKKRLIDIVDFA